MWCARLPLLRPDSAVVVRVGRNWAAFWSPFFCLRTHTRNRLGDTEMVQHFRE